VAPYVEPTVPLGKLLVVIEIPATIEVVKDREAV
jgi:hypothetical protein